MVNTSLEVLRDFCPAKPKYLPEDYPDLAGKVALVTGSNTGVGYESAKALLQQNASVIFLNRNKEKTNSAIEKIKNELTEVSNLNERIFSVIADLSDLTTIKPAVQEIETLGIDKIHLVILNAGVMVPPAGSKTKQGYELQIGTNVLGHHLLQQLLHPLVLNAVSPNFNPRVIWLSSSAHLVSYPNGGIKWDSFKDASKANTMECYGQSKAGDIYLAYIYGKLYKKDGIISLSVHPGYLSSELQRSMSGFQRFFLKGLFYPPVYGSYSELFAALNPEITTEDNGRYIGPWGVFKEVRSDVNDGFTDGTAQKLWDWATEEVEPYL